MVIAFCLFSTIQKFTDLCLNLDQTKNKELKRNEWPAIKSKRVHTRIDVEREITTDFGRKCEWNNAIIWQIFSINALNLSVYRLYMFSDIFEVRSECWIILTINSNCLLVTSNISCFFRITFFSVAFSILVMEFYFALFYIIIILIHCRWPFQSCYPFNSSLSSSPIFWLPFDFFLLFILHPALCSSFVDLLRFIFIIWLLRIK